LGSFRREELSGALCGHGVRLTLLGELPGKRLPEHPRGLVQRLSADQRFRCHNFPVKLLLGEIDHLDLDRLQQTMWSERHVLETQIEEAVAEY